MRLWQATWDPNGQLLLWGETARLEHTDQQDRPEASDAVPLHPHACSVPQLRKDLEVFDIPDAVEHELLISIPSTDEGPIHSPGLLVETQNPSNTPPELRVWRVPALRFAARDAVNLLTYRPPSTPVGLKMDDSFCFWREASKLLLELLTRGRFLPGIARNNSDWHARWRCRPSSPDRDRFF